MDSNELSQEVRIKILRKQIILNQVKSTHREGQRIQNQINELEQAQKKLVSEIQNLYQEAQKIDEWLLEVEYQSLLKAGK